MILKRFFNIAKIIPADTQLNAWNIAIALFFHKTSCLCILRYLQCISVPEYCLFPFLSVKEMFAYITA